MASSKVVVRGSKYRHLFGQKPKLEDCWQNVKVSRSAWEGNFIKANSKYVSVAWEHASGAGAVCVMPLNMPGKISESSPPLLGGHKGPVLDFDFHPFDDSLLATAAEDTSIMLWKIPEEGIPSPLQTPLLTLKGHMRRVGTVTFNHVAEYLLASATAAPSTSLSSSSGGGGGGGGHEVRIWDVGMGEEVINVDKAGYTDTILSLEWNYNGSLLATTCKDKKMRILDPRGNSVVSEVAVHEGAKSSRVTWVKNNKLISTGFTKTSEREIVVLDSRALDGPALSRTTLDSGSGVIMQFYDWSRDLLYLAGRGDGTIRYYEFTDADTNPLHYLSEFKSTTPQRGIAMLGARSLDTRQCELGRALKLQTTNGRIEPVSFCVPKRSEAFLEDLYPPSFSSDPALSADEWAEGATAEPRLVPTPQTEAIAPSTSDQQSRCFLANITPYVAPSITTVSRAAFTSSSSSSSSAPAPVAAPAKAPVVVSISSSRPPSVSAPSTPSVSSPAITARPIVVVAKPAPLAPQAPAPAPAPDQQQGSKVSDLASPAVAQPPPLGDEKRAVAGDDDADVSKTDKNDVAEVSEKEATPDPTSTPASTTVPPSSSNDTEPTSTTSSSSAAQIAPAGPTKVQVVTVSSGSSRSLSTSSTSLPSTPTVKSVTVISKSSSKDTIPPSSPSSDYSGLVAPESLITKASAPRRFGATESSQPKRATGVVTFDVSKYTQNMSDRPTFGHTRSKSLGFLGSKAAAGSSSSSPDVPRKPVVVVVASRPQQQSSSSSLTSSSSTATGTSTGPKTIVVTPMVVSKPSGTSSSSSSTSSSGSVSAPTTPVIVSSRVAPSGVSSSSSSSLSGAVPTTVRVVSAAPTARTVPIWANKSPSSLRASMNAGAAVVAGGTEGAPPPPGVPGAMTSPPPQRTPSSGSISSPEWTNTSLRPVSSRVTDADRLKEALAENEILKAKIVDLEAHLARLLPHHLSVATATTTPPPSSSSSNSNSNASSSSSDAPKMDLIAATPVDHAVYTVSSASTPSSLSSVDDAPSLHDDGDFTSTSASTTFGAVAVDVPELPTSEPSLSSSSSLPTLPPANTASPAVARLKMSLHERKDSHEYETTIWGHSSGESTAGANAAQPGGEAEEEAATNKDKHQQHEANVTDAPSTITSTTTSNDDNNNNNKEKDDSGEKVKDAVGDVPAPSSRSAADVTNDAISTSGAIDVAHE